MELQEGYCRCFQGLAGPVMTGVAALRKRFKSHDIEKLRGVELHHLMQTKETVQQLGIEVHVWVERHFPQLRVRSLINYLKAGIVGEMAKTARSSQDK